MEPRKTISPTLLTKIITKHPVLIHGSCGLRTVEPAVLQVLVRLVGILLAAELDVHVANQMLTQVVANAQLFHRPVLVHHLNKHVLVEVIKLALELLLVQRAPCTQQERRAMLKRTNEA